MDIKGENSKADKATLIEDIVLDQASQANNINHENDGHGVGGLMKKYIIANTLFMLFFILTCLALHITIDNMGVSAADTSVTQPIEPTQVTARGLAVDGAIVSDSACTVTSGTTYPTPSAGYVTDAVSEINGTLIVVVSSAPTPMDDSSCAPAQTVTVTVTASGSSMASYDAMSVGGAPPQSSDSTTNTTASVESTTSTDTTTTDVTVTMETTLSAATMTSTEYVTLTVGTITTYYVTADETTTSSEEEIVTVPFNPTGIDTAGTTWTYYVGSGTGTGASGTWVIVTPSANGSFTYTKPTHTSVTSVITSDASGKGRDRDRAVKSAFYCIVMTAAMASWFGIAA
ncbi:hypothetical protein C8A03DRAFT_31930 [Achaetomium macrosporum]|uniref:Uncharacterized protein n=1 Tax=Achaetomium macrosporum TaxID=79813 RepID=A0AAN7CDK3_9PEZI|nr:hypothetical protein C8A03DRAFT_31930 [Achaetomium macrosporum]